MRAGRTLRGACALPLALLLAVTACDHSAPFTSPDTGSDGPLQPGSVTRLTYGGSAGAPAWTPDGSEIVYSFVDLARPDDDRCLGVLPRAGGTMRRVICHATPQSTDTLDQLSRPAVSVESGLAFLHYSRRLGANDDRTRALLHAPWSDPLAATVIRTLPFPLASTELALSVSDVEWLAADRLAFLANASLIAAECPACPGEAVEAGRRIVIAQLGGSVPTFSEVALPGNPTSLAAGSGGALYYTLAGDGRVYRLPQGGVPEVAHDFGAEIVRDVHVAGSELVAVVGGSVEVLSITDGTLAQRDGGGRLVVVDLGDGTPQPIATPPLLFRDPAISPEGAAVVAVGVPYVLELIEGPEGEVLGMDTVVVGGPDLWRIGE